MNKRRLGKLRDTLRKLRPTVPGGGKNPARTLTAETTLCANAANLPAIDTFDFTTFHATGGPGDGGAAGCIAGVAIQLFPEAAARELEKVAHDPLQYDIGRSTADIVAQHVLGLDDRQGDQLLCAADEVRTDKPVTPEEAAVAVERLLDGDDAEEIWEHLCPEATSEEDPDEENARDFLDRRDEARISHRLGRPFTF